VICEERPIYGGTGQIDQKRFDEAGLAMGGAVICMRPRVFHS
jgi:hypothetical protein